MRDKVVDQIMIKIKNNDKNEFYKSIFVLFCNNFFRQFFRIFFSFFRQKIYISHKSLNLTTHARVHASFPKPQAALPIIRLWRRWGISESKRESPEKKGTEYAIPFFLSS